MQRRIEKLQVLLASTETLVDELTQLFKEEFGRTIETHIAEFSRESNRLENLSKVKDGLKILKEGVNGLANDN